MADEQSSMKLCSRCKRTRAPSDFTRNRASPDGLSFYCRPCTAEKAAERKAAGPRPSSVKLGEDGLPIAKLCARCGETKPVAAFKEAKRQRYGLDSWCRSCHAADKNKRYAENPEPARRYARERGKILWATEREKMRERERQRAIRHPGRTTANARLWRLTNIERARMFSAAWKRANRTKINAANRRRYAQDPHRFLNKVHRRRAKLLAGPGVSSADMARIRAAQRDRCAGCRRPLKGRGEQDHIIALSVGGLHKPSNVQLLCTPCNRAKRAQDPIEFMQGRGFLL